MEHSAVEGMGLQQEEVEGMMDDVVDGTSTGGSGGNYVRLAGWV